MRAIMLSYWVILTGVVFEAIGIGWDTLYHLTSQQETRGLFAPHYLNFIGLAMIIGGLVLGVRLASRR